MGRSSNIPLVQGSTLPVYVNVPVNFLRSESMNYHLP
jgi:hypothetical protein